MKDETKYKENKLTPEDARQFIESMYTMAILDQEGRYVYVNPGWWENSRWAQRQEDKGNHVKPEAILGRKVWEVVPDTKAGYVLDTGKPLLGEHIAPTGSFTTYMPRYDANGKQDGLYLYTILGNITEAAAFNKRLSELTSDTEYLRKELALERGARYTIDSIVGSSPAMQQLREQILTASRVPSPVLIEGETGTGKELIAHAIHASSPRAANNFVRVNCAAIPEDTIESELFGYKAGAVPAAGKKAKKGWLEMAQDGSLFMDDIDALPPIVQPKLLRALQEREIFPIGSERGVDIDTRIIASSNIPMHRMVEEGKFRQDLYFQINVINIVAPPLRSHKEDLPEITENLIARLNRELGMMIQGVDSHVMDMFCDYDWPGNIRELRNALERAMSNAKSSVLIPPDFSTLAVRLHRTQGVGFAPAERYPSVTDLRAAKDVTEKNMLIDALTLAKNNKSKAAKLLGISRSELYRKLERYDMK